SRFRALQQLDNADSSSPLYNGIRLELLGWADEHDPCDPFVPTGRFEGLPELSRGQWTALKIHNASTEALNVCLFDLQPGWSAVQIWPGDGRCSRVLDPDAYEVIALQIYLPPGYQDGVDILKAFATTSTTDFRWLELPPIDMPLQGTRSLNLGDPLEQMLTIFRDARPSTRHALATKASRGWTSAQVELRIR
ncbi:MAG: hypothetical protein KDK70_20285, partial [Myxococcales bacterium]|nr:hypothetical protein [Myxococcales bacterium]